VSAGNVTRYDRYNSDVGKVTLFTHLNLVDDGMPDLDGVKYAVFDNCRINDVTLVSILSGRTVALVDTVVILTNEPYGAVDDAKLFVCWNVQFDGERTTGGRAEISDNMELYLFYENRVGYEHSYFPMGLLGKMFDTEGGKYKTIPVDCSIDEDNEFFTCNHDADKCKCAYHSLSKTEKDLDDDKRTRIEIASYMCRQPVNVDMVLKHSQNTIQPKGTSDQGQLRPGRELCRRIANVSTCVRNVPEANFNWNEPGDNDIGFDAMVLDTKDMPCSLTVLDTHVIGMNGSVNKVMMFRLCSLLAKVHSDLFDDMESHLLRCRAVYRESMRALSVTELRKTIDYLNVGEDLIRHAMDVLSQSGSPMYWRILMSLCTDKMRMKINAKYYGVTLSHNTKEPLRDAILRSRLNYICLDDSESRDRDKLVTTLGRDDVDTGARIAVTNDMSTSNDTAIGDDIWCLVIGDCNDKPTICEKFLKTRKKVSMRNICIHGYNHIESIVENKNKKYFVNTLIIDVKHTKQSTDNVASLRPFDIHFNYSGFDQRMRINLCFDNDINDAEFVYDKRARLPVRLHLFSNNANVIQLDQVMDVFGRPTNVVIDIADDSQSREVTYSSNSRDYCEKLIAKNGRFIRVDGDDNVWRQLSSFEIKYKEVSDIANRVRKNFTFDFNLLVETMVETPMEVRSLPERIEMLWALISCCPSFALQSGFNIANDEPVPQGNFVIVPTDKTEITWECVVNLARFLLFHQYSS